MSRNALPNAKFNASDRRASAARRSQQRLHGGDRRVVRRELHVLRTAAPCSRRSRKNLQYPIERLRRLFALAECFEGGRATEHRLFFARALQRDGAIKGGDSLLEEPLLDENRAEGVLHVGARFGVARMDRRRALGGFRAPPDGRAA